MIGLQLVCVILMATYALLAADETVQLLKRNGFEARDDARALLPRARSVSSRCRRRFCPAAGEDSPGDKCDRRKDAAAEQPSRRH